MRAGHSHKLPSSSAGVLLSALLNIPEYGRYGLYPTPTTSILHRISLTPEIQQMERYHSYHFCYVSLHETHTLPRISISDPMARYIFTTALSLDNLILSSLTMDHPMRRSLHSTGAMFGCCGQY